MEIGIKDSDGLGLVLLTQLNSSLSLSFSLSFLFPPSLVVGTYCVRRLLALTQINPSHSPFIFSCPTVVLD